MFIKNATYKTISTEGQSFPIAEGTIISNGIVPQTIEVDPATHRISVAIGGTIDLSSPANKNVSFTAEQMKALGGDFNFVPAEEAKSELPAVSDADNGDVPAVVDGAWGKSDPPSSLPSYTSADKGKVLGLGEGDTSTTEVIVPEQSVTTEYSSYISKYMASVEIDDVSQPSADYTYTMTINGTDYPVVINGWQYWTNDHEYGIGPNIPDITSWNFVALNAEAADTYTVSLTRSVPSVEPKWENVGIPAYTEEDIGSVLTVAEADAEYIVPETTLTSADFVQYETPSVYAYLYSGELIAGNMYVYHLETMGQSEDFLCLAVEQGGVVQLIPDEGELPLEVVYAQTFFGNNIAFISNGQVPSGITIKISLKPFIFSPAWEKQTATVETIYNSNGIEVAFATYRGDMVTISTYGSGVSSSYFSGANFPKVSAEYADGLGVARAYTAVFDSSNGNYKGLMYIGSQGICSFSSGVSGTIQFANFSYKYEE